jgi:hypothetical protein
MSAQIDDGGPAFPEPSRSWQYSSNGMSLRDWFAGQALAGILMNYTTQKFGATEQTAAEYAYRYADAMIAARKGQP